ncbi:MAG TPA: aminoglycoside phosphotransferase family protein [Anaerolineales bacterium]|nr:aminoglycoside phosphotransferase family protein [Anaerolineales bacterium]
MDMVHRLSVYLASRYSDVAISTFDFLVSGFESDIYTFQIQRSNSVKSYILRLFTGAGATKKLAQESRALSLLHKADYPVPALFLQETNPEILGKPFEIIERLEGQALWPVLTTAAVHQQGQLLARFGSLLAQLHKLDWHLFTTNSEVYEKNPELWLDEIISQYRSLYTRYDLKGCIQLVNWLDSHKHEVSVQPAVVHQDFHANNVLLCSNDQLFVIDWTQFAVSDHRIDLAWALLIMGDLGNPDWGKQIFNAYASGFKGLIQQLDYFNVIVYMKLLASTVISFTFGPEEIGLRAEAVKLTKEQLSIYKRIYRRLRDITGLNAPELEDIFERI